MPTTLASQCIYTILHPDKLAEAAMLRGPSTFIVRQRMVSALELFNDARESDMDVAIVFGDATDCRKLIYSGKLTHVDVGGSDAHYSVFALKLLKAGRRPQELVLVSNGERIAEGFIRPYAICQTPTFVS